MAAVLLVGLATATLLEIVKISFEDIYLLKCLMREIEIKLQPPPVQWTSTQLYTKS